jgi:phosphoribosyl 1,2-cyclic phosphate phosphodiesterase
VKIQFLGTCACDYSDKLKNEFKDKFDNDARRSSAVLINDHILIDCGEHILESLDILNIPYAQITDILITHTHDDHFNPQNIEKIAKNRHTPLNLWVRKDAKIPEIFGITLKRLSPYCKAELEKDAYITSLIANHDPSTFPQHFLLEIYGKKMFYGCDGAWLLTQTYNYLSNTNLDLMVFDATVGDYIGDYRLAEHNSIPMIRLMIPSLKVNGTINDKTKIILSHIAPSLHKPHDEIQKIASEFCAEVAYDGQIKEV